MEKNNEFTLTLTIKEIKALISLKIWLENEGYNEQLTREIRTMYKKFLFIENRMDGKSLQEAIINLTIS